jgi:hypothetical protein
MPCQRKNHLQKKNALQKRKSVKVKKPEKLCTASIPGGDAEASPLFLFVFHEFPLTACCIIG